MNLDRKKKENHRQQLRIGECPTKPTGVENDGFVNKAQKLECTDGRTGYRSGYRVRRFDTRLGTMYLFVPKIRKGGYIPFFVTEKSVLKQH